MAPRSSSQARVASAGCAAWGPLHGERRRVRRRLRVGGAPDAAAPLGAPLHRHSREDEYSFVLEGRIGARLGDQVVFAEPGELVFKPRDQWHTFWNAGDTEARLLEIISPAGFERYFEELVKLFAAGPLSPGVLAEVARRYGLEVDASSVPGLVAEHGLIV